MNKQQAIQQVTSSYPSIWSKEDVLKLLNQLEEATTDSHTTDKFKMALKDAVEDVISNICDDDIVDTDSIHFEIWDRNKISVESIDINRDNIINVVTDAIDDFISNY